MRKRKSRKTSSSPNAPAPIYMQEGNESSARLPWDYSQPTLRVKGTSEFESTQSFECQVTIRAKVELSRHQVCILAAVALFDVAHHGLKVSDWIILEWIYSYLLGSKLDPLERNDSRERELALLLKIVLISGTWMGLEEKNKLPRDIQELIFSSRWIPSSRTYNSWKQIYVLDKFLEVRIVPLDLFMERSKRTTRYSSYCKGYGESSHMGRRQKTRPSSELDGEPVDLERKEISKSEKARLTELVLKEIKYRTLRRK